MGARSPLYIKVVRADDFMVRQWWRGRVGISVPTVTFTGSCLCRGRRATLCNNVAIRFVSFLP